MGTHEDAPTKPDEETTAVEVNHCSVLKKDVCIYKMKGNELEGFVLLGNQRGRSGSFAKGVALDAMDGIQNMGRDGVFW